MAKQRSVPIKLCDEQALAGVGASTFTDSELGVWARSLWLKRCAGECTWHPRAVEGAIWS
eukprot:2636467-Pleurochrysis_carterae.AAC.3